MTVFSSLGLPVSVSRNMAPTITGYFSALNGVLFRVDIRIILPLLARRSYRLNVAESLQILLFTILNTQGRHTAIKTWHVGGAVRN